MKIDDYINEVIEKEKKIQSNPFLATRIMAKLAPEQILSTTHRKMPAWKITAVAASFAMVVWAGVSLGKIGNNLREYAAVNVNDFQIENLTLYITE